jgi:hypothetical protein
MPTKLVNVGIKVTYWEQLKRFSAKYNIEPEEEVNFIIGTFLDWVKENKKETIHGKED